MRSLSWEEKFLLIIKNYGKTINLNKEMPRRGRGVRIFIGDLAGMVIYVEIATAGVQFLERVIKNMIKSAF